MTKPIIYFISYLQAKEDGDKPGLEAMLQKVLQLYASKVLSKRSYAKKGKYVALTDFLDITEDLYLINNMVFLGQQLNLGKVTCLTMVSLVTIF